MEVIDSIPYSQRPQWADVTPIPQNDGKNPVVPISYSPEFKDVHDYFRAVLVSGEHSPRTLALTADVIEQNAANYTAWHFRRQIIESLNSDLHKEIEYLNVMTKDSPKNYQVWYHRKAILELLQDTSVARDELELIADSLAEDSKNYHAWGHRQWVLSTFDLWDKELAYVERLLVEDIRNNSAWNQRYFVVSKTSDISSAQVIQQELSFALQKVKLLPGNTAAWHYVRGLFRYGAKFADFPQVKEACLNIVRSSPDCLCAQSMLVDIHAQVNNNKSLQAAVEICEKLGEMDPIRQKYWFFRQKQLQSKLK